MIDRKVALLNPKELGLKIQVLLSVSMARHSKQTRREFEEHVQTLPEVMECYSVSGGRDYVLLDPEADDLVHLLGCGLLLQEVAEVRGAATVAEAYAIKPLISEADGVRDGGCRVVNIGTSDRNGIV